jgi:hypothetical protein
VDCDYLSIAYSVDNGKRLIQRVLSNSTHFELAKNLKDDASPERPHTLELFINAGSRMRATQQDPWIMESWGYVWEPATRCGGVSKADALRALVNREFSVRAACRDFGGDQTLAFMVRVYSRDAMRKWPLFEVRDGSRVSNGQCLKFADGGLRLVRIQKDELLVELVRKYVEHVVVMKDVPEHAR